MKELKPVVSCIKNHLEKVQPIFSEIPVTFNNKCCSGRTQAGLSKRHTGKRGLTILDRTKGPEEDSVTDDPKDKSITEYLKEDPITEHPREPYN